MGNTTSGGSRVIGPRIGLPRKIRWETCKRRKSAAGSDRRDRRAVLPFGTVRFRNKSADRFETASGLVGTGGQRPGTFLPADDR